MSTVAASKLSNLSKTKDINVDSVINNTLRLLKPSASAPTVREDGTALQVGDQYTNSTDSLQYKFTSSGWVTSDTASLVRTAIASAVGVANKYISSLRVNVWETPFVMLITNKPTSDPSTWDWTPAIDAASVYVKANGGGDVEFTAGTFQATRIYRRSGVSLVGRGCSATYLQAIEFNPGSEPYGFIEQESGPVIGSHMRGLHLLGLPASNPNQWAMYLHAKWDPTYTHGGLWMSVHDDIRATFFNKGIWSRGGYTVAHYKRPQQFLDFRSVYVQVPNGGEAIRLTGQHGQINFTLGSGEGRDGNIALRCVTVAFDPEPSTTADNLSGNGESTSDVSGVGNAVQAPINVIFGQGFSAQKSQEGFRVQSGRNIVISGIWCENVGKFLTLANNSHVQVEKNHLAKAAAGEMFSSPGSGYLMSCQSNSTLIWRNDNNITGTVDSFTNPTDSANNFTGVDLKVTYYNGDTTGKFKTAGFKSVSIDAAGKLSVAGHKFSIISANADPSITLKTLNSNAAPGEEVCLRANSGTITLSVGGNISLNGRSTITIPQFGVIRLMRIFEVGGSGEYIVSGTPEIWAAAVPSSGYYSAGTRIYNTAPVAGGSDGWVCTTAGIAGSTAVFKAMSTLAA